VLTTQAGSPVYDVTKDLSAGDHSFTLSRRTEPNDGVVEISAGKRPLPIGVLGVAVSR
jgi:hypothetical protein